MPDPVLVWVNADQDSGIVRGLEHLVELIGRIGTSPAWVWLELFRAGQDRPFAQACGHHHYGLVVEFSTDDWAARVAPIGAPSQPHREVGTYDWSCLAHPAELHPLPVAVSLMHTWVTASEYPYSHYELRDEGGFVGWQNTEGDWT